VTRPRFLQALTLVQPWATCVADCGKWIENRDWPPPSTLFGQYLAIHAAKRCDPADYAAVSAERVKLGIPKGALPAPEQMPLGVIVAVARLRAAVRVDVRDFGQLHVQETRGEPPEQLVAKAIASPWAKGIWLWLLDDVFRLPTPLPHRGMQKLWVVQPHEHELVRLAWREAHPERSATT
jgi:hypothetical protein